MTHTPGMCCEPWHGPTRRRTQTKSAARWGNWAQGVRKVRQRGARDEVGATSYTVGRKCLQNLSSIAYLTPPFLRKQKTSHGR
eukprot:scaffold23452_cov55-Phaeocystis_antarctica.AAC.1